MRRLAVESVEPNECERVHENVRRPGCNRPAGEDARSKPTSLLKTFLERNLPMSQEHVLDGSLIHHDWDNSREPVLAIESGDVVHFDLKMAGAGQVHESSSVEDVVWDFDTIYNLAGPIHVEGSAPRDTLKVEILSLTPGSWGWTAVIPELGLLPDDFPTRCSRSGIFAVEKQQSLPGRSACRSCPSSERWASRWTNLARGRRSLPTRAAETWTTGTSSQEARSGSQSGAMGRSFRAVTLTPPRETVKSV
jgi:hypothetical protein